MIIAGFLGGRLAHWAKFPMITGYIIVGVVLSPSVAEPIGVQYFI
jgi:Kef-type K+ transport system membrane component KefB